MNGPWVTAYTSREGGEWLPLSFDVSLDHLNLDGVQKACHESGCRVGTLCGITVHSLRFSDGREWDVINGWRK